jgi:hypothetical protein
MEEVKEAGVSEVKKSNFIVLMIYYPILSISAGFIANFIFPWRHIGFVRTIVHYALLGIVMVFIQKYVAESKLPFIRKLIRFAFLVAAGIVLSIGIDKLIF